MLELKETNTMSIGITAVVKYLLARDLETPEWLISEKLWRLEGYTNDRLEYFVYISVNGCDDQYAEALIWVMENVKRWGNTLPYEWYFENNEEATLFKLIHG